ncbi:hypothetical protein NL676_026229 [Syzygium grande]|nr:hypothetical protein NL676_026229 [Syzygium grande]
MKRRRKRQKKKRRKKQPERVSKENSELSAPETPTSTPLDISVFLPPLNTRRFHLGWGWTPITWQVATQRLAAQRDAAPLRILSRCIARGGTSAPRSPERN